MIGCPFFLLTPDESDVRLRHEAQATVVRFRCNSLTSGYRILLTHIVGKSVEYATRCRNRCLDGGTQNTKRRVSYPQPLVDNLHLDVGSWLISVDTAGKGLCTEVNFRASIGASTSDVSRPQPVGEKKICGRRDFAWQGGHRPPVGPPPRGHRSRLPSHSTPNSHPVCRRPTRMWSGRGAGRQGGARHCTNDLDARCRGRSACPGPMADGMGVPRLSHPRSALASGAPAILEPEAPAGGMSVTDGTGGRWGLPHALGPIPSCRGGRRRSGGGAGRRQERRPERSREARPAERSAAGCLMR